MALLGLKPLAGRQFSASDDASAPPVAILSSSLAHQLFERSNVIGDEITWHGTRRIIGVVPDVMNPDGSIRPTLYVSRFQEPLVKLTVLARATRGHPLGRVARAIARVDPDQPFDRVVPLSDVTQLAFARQLTFRTVAMVMAGCVFLVCGCGVYGAVKHWMIRRGQELGVRLALGATPARVVLGDLRRQAPIYAVSGIIGLPVGLLVMRAASVVAAPLAMPTMTALLASWAIAILVAAAISATMTLRAIRFEPINLFRQSAN
jgi:hypothetical protein